MSLLTWRDTGSSYRKPDDLYANESPLEATAWENGFVRETKGLPPVQLERRIQGSLLPLAYMVSRPRQPTTAREGLLRVMTQE